MDVIDKKRWKVHCLPTPPEHQGAAAIVNYLAAYVSGTAIGNSRLISDDGVNVTFRYKDYRTNEIKTFTLPGVKFVQDWNQPSGRQILAGGVSQPVRKIASLLARRAAHVISCLALRAKDSQSSIPVGDAAGNDVSASGLTIATVRAAVRGDRVIHDLDASAPRQHRCKE